MAHYVEQLWNPRETAGLSRRDRTPGRFFAFVPDELGDVLPTVGEEARRASEDALSALARADERIGDTGGYLNHLLIRSESLSSSWIEGNRVTPKRLAIAEIQRFGPKVALDVVRNVHATEEAIDRLADRTYPVSVADIENLQHRIEPDLEPGIRAEQNWVGGPGWSPLRADFIPPPPEEVPRLLADTARAVTATAGNAVIRAALVHAQFETIHPFLDGNGRTGRALIHTVLRRSDALRYAVIPISTVFSGHLDSYIEGLNAFRADPPRIDDWVVGFARACELAVDSTLNLVREIGALDERLLAHFIRHRGVQGRSPAVPRRDAVTRRILARLASEPVLTVSGVATRHRVSEVAAHRALTELTEAKILSGNRDQKGRTLCWSADHHLGLVSLTERSARVGGIDTARVRRVPGPPAPRQGGIRVDEDRD